MTKCCRKCYQTLSFFLGPLMCQCVSEKVLAKCFQVIWQQQYEIIPVRSKEKSFTEFGWQWLDHIPTPEQITGVSSCKVLIS